MRQDNIKYFLSYNAINATVREGEDEILSRALRTVAYALEEEYEKMAATHDKHANDNTWDPALHGGIDPTAVADRVGLITMAQADQHLARPKESLPFSTRLASPIAQLAFGIIMWIGDAFSAAGITTSWLIGSKSLLPVVFGVSLH